MVNEISRESQRARLFDLRAMGRDYQLLLVGFPFSILAFSALLPMFLLSLSTLILWVGVLLLPVTLKLASFFAEGSRARARRWGADLPPARYASAAPGFAGFLGAMKDGRRWLDLAFESLIAFPLRACNFTVALCWGIAALGEMTFPLWGGFLPPDNYSLGAITAQWLSGEELLSATHGPFWIEAAINLVIGCVLLLTLPLVLRGLASFEILITKAGLGSAEQREGWQRITAGVIAIVSIAVGWPILSTLYGVPVVVAMLIVLASGAALMLTGRLPLVAIVLQTAAVLATMLASSGIAGAGSTGSADVAGWPWPWPVTTIIVQTLFTMLVALRCRLPWAIAAWAIPQAAVSLASIPFGITVANQVSITVSGSVSLGVLIVSAIVRQLLSSRGALQAERQTSAELSEQSRELAERNRIAQELHDVVAHSMSVISVQATTAKYRLPDVGDQAEQEFESIAASSRQALSEMRSLLTLLRSSDEDRQMQLAPQPGAHDIPALITATRQSGVNISLAMTRNGEMFSTSDAAAEATNTSSAADTDAAVTAAASKLPAATGLTVYRMVQEALSNAMRHSPGSDIDVRVDETDTEVTVEVRNSAPVDAHSQPAAPGAGLGLAGVRERVAALGGSVTAEPNDASGFIVRAVLPLG